MARSSISYTPVFKTFVSDEQSIFPVDTIEYQERLWLVPEWFVNDHEGWRTPKRIIGLSNFELSDLRGKGHAADFFLPAPIPKTMLDALFRGKSLAGFEVKENPPVRCRIPPEKMH